MGATGVGDGVAMLAAAFWPAAAGAAAGDNTQAVDGRLGRTLDRKAVEKIVREYLLANPELLLEVQQALDAKQKEEQSVAHRRSSRTPRTRSSIRA